jgi:hypothetical protein
MLPIVTGIASAPGLASIRAAMCSDNSMPCTGTRRALSASATRPVPVANSSAGPSPASAASRPVIGSSTVGENMSAYVLSYTEAISGPQLIVLMSAACRTSTAER